eukprot:CAMPEP_0197002482 /NCGR_PEP_ID=MMETSP1380-20130617/6974_1 /TAXON_ID=5936 /ORGANISM="Euplotes crassus, Strain CT5" /LENGTH=133 /DNA_ID=CAMNT_0042420627 /DNA_START=82 /DNA_END=480 /DNA_ORIENTATION=+
MRGRGNKKFDSLLPDDIKSYGHYNQYKDELSRLNGHESKNKEARDLYPTSSSHYNPYNGGSNQGYGQQYNAPAPAPMPRTASFGQYEPPTEPTEPVPQPAYYAHPAYDVPKYQQEYSSPPQRHFIHNTERKRL